MLRNIYLGIVFVFLLLVFSFSFLTFKVRAVEPIPTPGKIPCTSEKDPEFNSSRPYQASPCGDSIKAMYCSNSIIFTEDTPAKRVTGSPDSIEVDLQVQPKTYSIDLSNAELPILGNTEQVKNSQSSEDSLDDAQKVNGYVSWYLSGVTDKAEYGQTDPSKIIDFSGPLKKLLPGAIQDAERIDSIKNVSLKSVSKDEGSDEQVSGPQNHNQIVVCADENVLGILGNTIPHECYAGNGSKAKEDKYRLKDWTSGDLGIGRKAANEIAKLLSKIPGVSDSIIGESLRSAWNQRIPPLPWGKNQDGQPFKSDVEYQKAYNEWRGKTCVLVPIINKLFCMDLDPTNLLISSKWSDLFPYIPLANTADKNAKQFIEGVGVKPSNKTEIIPPVSPPEIISEPVLYFAHTEESLDLGNSLKSTYNPKEGTDSAPPSDTTESPIDPETGKCRILDVRSNEGDNLFPEVKANNKPSIQVTVGAFTVTRIPCKVSDALSRENGFPVSICKGEVSIEIRTKSRTPYAEQIFNTTTAGADSIFRKMFPKVETGAPVTCIANVPAVSSVNYKAVEGTSSKFKVEGPDGTNSTDNPKLYFPYLGSVYDYFLKGIQTALRPQGYGDPIASGKYCKPTTPSQCDKSVPDSKVPSKFLGSFKANFIDLADRFTSDCPGPEMNLADECYNYVVSESEKAGVNPAFTLTIWLNESGASNYCHGGPTTQDFGVNISALYQNFTGQLAKFLTLPAAFEYCKTAANWNEPMHAFLSRFQSSAGACDPSDPVANQYYEDVKSFTWPVVAGSNCVKGGKFAISWPTDGACP